MGWWVPGWGDVGVAAVRTDGTLRLERDLHRSEQKAEVAAPL